MNTYPPTSRRVIGMIGLLVGGWILVGMGIRLAVIQSLPFEPTFPYGKEVLPKYGSRLLTTSAHFDGVHYLTIIEKGYEGTGLIQAFFPAYPLVVKLFSFKGIVNPIFVGMVISILSLIGAYYVWYRLMELDGFVATDRWWVIGLHLMFPVAFFLSALYSESLFLLLSLSTFYLARKRSYILAGIVGAVAAATRVSGVFLAVGLLVEYWQQERQWNRAMLWCLLPSIGLLGYMSYLGIVFGDPLMFASVQASFGADRQTSSLVSLPQVIYRYIRMMITVKFQSLLMYQIVHEFVVSILALIGLVWGFFRLRISYMVYSLLAFLLPTLTGTFSSMPRYVLVLFPLFMLIPIVLRKRLHRILVLLLFGLLQVLNMVLFIMGYWVA